MFSVSAVPLYSYLQDPRSFVFIFIFLPSLPLGLSFEPALAAPWALFLGQFCPRKGAWALENKPYLRIKMIFPEVYKTRPHSFIITSHRRIPSLLSSLQSLTESTHSRSIFYTLAI